MFFLKNYEFTFLLDKLQLICDILLYSMRVLNYISECLLYFLFHLLSVFVVFLLHIS